MSPCFVLFFFNDTATTEIYTLSLHDALPIWSTWRQGQSKQIQNEDGERRVSNRCSMGTGSPDALARSTRSEEHTSELQSRQYLVCRLLLEKKTTSRSHGRTRPSV